jgi:hypothetical protein
MRPRAGAADDTPALLGMAAPTLATQFRTPLAIGCVVLAYYVIIICATQVRMPHGGPHAGLGRWLRHPGVQWLGIGVGATAVVLGPTFVEYGPNFFLPQHHKMLSISPHQWSHQILPRKTVLLVGGHHRAGTTLLWKLLAQHSSIGGFGEQHETGADFSEGVFLQVRDCA